MSSIRSSGSKAELALGTAMWQRGLRYRKQYRKLPGRPDYAFVGARVAVFCDGDFWHGRDFAERVEGGRFKTNRRYWLKKISRNMKRDALVTSTLRRQGWRVLRFWESRILKDPGPVANRVLRAVEVRKARSSRSARRQLPEGS